MLDFTDLPEKLAQRLLRPLPGERSQNKMSPEGRNLLSFRQKKTAAVLIALFRNKGNWFFPMIHRVEDGFAHSGQIAFPGGKIEHGETFVEAALREAKEEISLNNNLVEVLGELTPLAIPVSGFLVYPVVGYIRQMPDLKKNPDEVQAIFNVRVEELFDPDSIQHELWEFGTKQREVPYFKLQGHKVWGATAMILSEFKSVIKSL